MKLFVSIPTIDGKITADTFTAITRFARDPALCIESKIMQWGQDVVRTRNRSVYEFLRSDCTHLWFVDADVGFTPEVVAALAASGMDFACGTYPKKKVNWEALGRVARGSDESPFEWAHVIAEDAEEREIGGRQFKRAELVPMGCTLLSRKLLEAVTRDVPTYGDRYDGEVHQVHALFNLEMIEQAHGFALLPEDYSFTLHARRHGFDPWVLLDPICTHTGSMRFDVREIMRGVRGG